MNRISTKDFSLELLADGTLSQQLPEYYSLKEVVESQGWDDDESVFDHSLNSARALRTIMMFDYLPDSDRKKLTNYLHQPFEGHTRMQLLEVATLLHDIGKIVSLQRNAQGNTSSPSHGILGSWLAGPLLEKIDLTKTEKQFVLELIADHLVPSDLIELSINNGTKIRNIMDLLVSNRPNTCLELLLLSYADWMGCGIRDSVREEREKRVVIVHECFSIFAGSI